MTDELARRGKFTKTITDHLFRNPDLDEDLAVVDRKNMPDHFRGDLRCARPGFDGRTAGRLLHFREKFRIDVWAFL